MSYFTGLVRNEWMKMSSKRQFPYFVIFLVVMIIGIGTAMRFLISSSSSEIGMADFMEIMSMVCTAVTMFFMVVVSAQSMTDEYKDGTIKQLLIRPASRTTVLMSKLMNLLLILLAVYVIMTAAAWLVGLVLFSGDSSTTVQEVLQGALLSLPTAIFYSLLAFMMAVLTKSIGLAISVPIILQSIIAPLTSMLSQKSWYMLLIFPNLDWAPYFMKESTVPYIGASLWLALLIYGVYMLILLLVTIFVFNKRDVQ